MRQRGRGPARGKRTSLPYSGRQRGPGRPALAEATLKLICPRRAVLEGRLMHRVLARCGKHISKACRYSSVPEEFLAALVANESGGNPKAARFEPAVYRHLKAVAEGQAPRYGGIGRESLDAEIEAMLHPKAGAFHAAYLNASFTAHHAAQLATARDEALRELATSWGLTQIMGYHLVGREGTVRDLLEPPFHFHLALALLAEFAERYQLDLAREFEEMFRCWNTGQPYGKTFHPDYVLNGLCRMAVYRQLTAPNREAQRLAA